MPEEKLRFLQKTSLFKPSQKNRKKIAQLAQGLGLTKCPVYQCEFTCSTPVQVESHYEQEHSELIKLGLTLKSSHKDRPVEATVKDSLLTQVLLFALTNKSQVRRFQNDHEKELVETYKRQKRE